MSKEKKIEGKIGNFYKKKTIDLCMFAYVQGFTDALPAVKIKDAICFWMKEYSISEDDYPLETAMRTYSRIKKDFIWKDT